MEEKLAELIENAVANGIRRGMGNNLQSTDGKDPYELLTAKQVHEEFGIGMTKVRRMFKDPDLPTQRYISPQRVARIEVQKYMTVKRDYLCGKE